MRRPPFWRWAAHRLARSLDTLSGLVGAPAYGGAQSNRLTLDWARAPVSPDKEAQGSLTALRARSREAQRNSPYGAQYIRLLVDNVVGARGITFQSKAMTRKGHFDTAVNAAVEQGWAAWGTTGVCTTDGKYSWTDVQRMATALVHGDGECFVRLRRGAGVYGLQLQILDADLLDEQYNRRGSEGGAEIRQGIEVTADGRPAAYHFFTRHPDDINAAGGTRTRVRLPADEIIHLFLPYRVGQTRGVPGLTPVLYQLRMLTGYQEAEVVAARVSATKLGIITQTAESYGPVPGESPTGAGPVAMDAEPGSFWEFEPGKTLTTFDPQHPSTAYRDFVKGVLHAVAAGLGVSYASLTADLEGTSYASGRTGLLQERDRYRGLQTWLVEHLHARVFAEWLQYASLGPLSAVPEAKLATVLAAATWQPRGFAWVDPKSDVDAVTAQLEHGLTSRTRVLAEQGLDIEETLDELARETALAEERGVSITPAPASVAAPAADTADDTADRALDRALRLVREMPLPSPAAVVAPAAAGAAPVVNVSVDQRPRAVDEEEVDVVTDEHGRILEAVVVQRHHVTFEHEQDGTVRALTAPKTVTPRLDAEGRIRGLTLSPKRARTGT